MSLDQLKKTPKEKANKTIYRLLDYKFIVSILKTRV